MPETLYKNTIMMAAPVTVVDQVLNALATVTGLPLDYFTMRLRLSPSGQEPATMLLSSGVYTDLQVQAMRPLFAAGGPLWLIGARARRGLNEASESTVGEPGKLSVTVMDTDAQWSEGTDWSVVRLTLARFLQELQVARIYPPI